ncbi:MAG: alkaline phosphatase family protein, partial [Candidatus Omnitrophica bacterium]|nr:alkaline phosphatase family protein [Candidatus Omnitrophota bacterium]
MINYYVDPGSGFVFVQGASFLWGIILGLLGAGWVFFKFFFGYLKKFIWVLLILLILSSLIIGGIMMIHKPANKKKVVILGIDAMDPGITEKLIQEGRLPNFLYLKTKGAYSRLETTIPSESVVAWTSFSTGLNPGGHGIFDFVMRDPQSYSLYLSFNEVSNAGGKTKVKIRKQGEAFWDILSRNKVNSAVYFCPNTFPAQPLSGKMLSGMGVPDLYGTIGRFSFYTSRPLAEKDKDSRGKILHVEPNGNVIETNIYGPKVSSKASINEAVIPLKIRFMPGREEISLEFQGKKVFLKRNNWSGWQRVSFKIGLFKNAHGIIRFYLKSIEPEFELYISPVNLNPEKPVFPISYPYDYSKKLAKEDGLYYTQGMPHDTWALSENRIDEKVFLGHVDKILEERTRILEGELKKLKSGAFFFYFDALDAVQHMFWRYIDNKHPLHEENALYQDTIFKYYEKMDSVIGEVLKKIDGDTELIVLSDHGFGSFRRAVHLNRWLLENGYLFLKEGMNEAGEFFEGLDWNKTKAYALGFGGIYLNIADRERYGAVDPRQARELKTEITEKL